jgi:glutathione S-transferase
VITLIDVPMSPYAQKVKLALLEKGLAFETRRVDLTRPDAQLEALSPRREVPVLIDSELEVYDSSVIVEYLEDAYPEPALLPRGAAERARVRTLEELCDTAYEAIVWGVSEVNVFKRAEGELKQALLARASAQVASLNARLERALEGRQWLNGESFGFGDIVVYPHVNAASSQGNKPEPGSRLDTWLRAVRQRPSAQRVKQDIVGTLQDYATVPKRIAAAEAQRQYRDHRLDWMIRSGGAEVVLAGIADHNIRFSVDL